MIGNHPSVKGGITSVISQMLKNDWNKVGVSMKFIPTFIEVDIVRKSLYFVLAYMKILWSLLFFKPDILHIHMSYKGSFRRKYLVHKLCKAFCVKDIIHLHGSEFKRFYMESNDKNKAKIRTLLRECHYMIVLGDEWNKKIKDIEPLTKTVVISNTVRIPQETVRWNDECFQVLFLGVLIERKGVHDLLNAIALMKKDGLDNVKFVIAGTGVEEENLMRQCNELELGNYVEFTGWITSQRKVDLLKQSQMLVLPSYNEGLPIAILEAISYGLPVVSTNVGDIAAAVLDGKNGYLIEPADVNGLANAMRNIMTDKEQYTLMSKASRRLAEVKFSDEKYFDLIKKIYFT